MTVEAKLSRRGFPLALVTLSAWLAAACQSNIEEEVSLSEGQAYAELERAEGYRLKLATFGSGGGAGDITYRLIGCLPRSSTCEILANISTNDGRRPDLGLRSGKLVLVVNETDYVTGFRNYSRRAIDLPPGSITLMVRPTGSADAGRSAGLK
jgi:hypothetical protein